MAVRKYISEDEHQILNVDYSKRFIQNSSKDWQILFNSNSSLSQSGQQLKVAAQFDTDDLSSVRFIGYLYRQNSGTIDAAASCTFNIYLVGGVNTWTETLIGSFNGAIQPNGYYFSDIDILNLLPASMDGESTLMVEVVATRKTQVYRERMYFNHLGIFENALRLKNKITMLEITKKDE